MTTTILFTFTLSTIQILNDDTPKCETIDVTVTGRSSTTLIIRHNSQKRRLSCNTPELLDELSSKLPCRRTVTIESNIITAYNK